MCFKWIIMKECFPLLGSKFTCCWTRFVVRTREKFRGQSQKCTTRWYRELRFNFHFFNARYICFHNVSFTDLLCRKRIWELKFTHSEFQRRGSPSPKIWEEVCLNKFITLVTENFSSDEVLNAKPVMKFRSVVRNRAGLREALESWPHSYIS